MKKLVKIAIVLIIAAMIPICILTIAAPQTENSLLDNYYTTTAIAVEVDEDIVLFEDASGNLWEVEAENIEVGDLFSLLMDNNGSEMYFNDDKIVSYEFGNLINQSWD